MKVITFILVLFLSFLETAAFVDCGGRLVIEPTDILPCRFYGKFHVDSRKGWFYYLDYQNVPTFAKWLAYGSNVRYVERTGDPKYFNIIEGTKDENTTYMFNIQLNVPHEVHGLKDGWILYYLENNRLYHQLRDENNQPLKKAPLIADKFTEDHLIDMETTFYYGWDGKKYKEAKWLWKRGEEKPFFERLKDWWFSPVF